MKRRIMTVTGLMVLLGLLFNGAVFAQDANDAGQDTMMVVDENQRPEDFVNRIALPEHALREGIKDGQLGLETGKQARERSREGARERTQEAQQDGVMQRVRDRDQVMDQAREQMRDRIRDRLGDQITDPEGLQEWRQEHDGQVGGNGNRR